MTPDELVALVPGCADVRTGKFQRAVALACAERMQASFAAYSGLRSPGSSGPAVPPGKIIVRIPHDGEGKGDAWTLESPVSSLERLPVELVIEFPEGHTGA
jgi:hypothetical protein